MLLNEVINMRLHPNVVMDKTVEISRNVTATEKQVGHRLEIQIFYTPYGNGRYTDDTEGYDYEGMNKGIIDMIVKNCDRIIAEDYNANPTIRLNGDIIYDAPSKKTPADDSAMEAYEGTAMAYSSLLPEIQNRYKRLQEHIKITYDTLVMLMGQCCKDEKDRNIVGSIFAYVNSKSPARAKSVDFIMDVIVKNILAKANGNDGSSAYDFNLFCENNGLWCIEPQVQKAEESTENDSKTFLEAYGTVWNGRKKWFELRPSNDGSSMLRWVIYMGTEKGSMTERCWSIWVLRRLVPTIFKMLQTAVNPDGVPMFGDNQIENIDMIGDEIGKQFTQAFVNMGQIKDLIDGISVKDVIDSMLKDNPNARQTAVDIQMPGTVSDIQDKIDNVKSVIDDEYAKLENAYQGGYRNDAKGKQGLYSAMQDTITASRNKYSELNMELLRVQAAAANKAGVDINTVKSKTQWFKEGCIVKRGETPYFMIVPTKTRRANKYEKAKFINDRNKKANSDFKKSLQSTPTNQSEYEKRNLQMIPSDFNLHTKHQGSIRNMVAMPDNADFSLKYDFYDKSQVEPMPENWRMEHQPTDQFDGYVPAEGLQSLVASLTRKGDYDKVFGIIRDSVEDYIDETYGSNDSLLVYDNGQKKEIKTPTGLRSVLTQIAARELQNEYGEDKESILGENADAYINNQAYEIASTIMRTTQLITKDDRNRQGLKNSLYDAASGQEQFNVGEYKGQDVYKKKSQVVWDTMLRVSNEIYDKLSDFVIDNVNTNRQNPFGTKKTRKKKNEGVSRYKPLINETVKRFEEIRKVRDRFNNILNKMC